MSLKQINRQGVSQVRRGDRLKLAKKDKSDCRYIPPFPGTLPGCTEKKTELAEKDRPRKASGLYFLIKILHAIYKK